MKQLRGFNCFASSSTQWDFESAVELAHACTLPAGRAIKTIIGLEHIGMWVTALIATKRIAGAGLMAELGIIPLGAK